jgi:hypothetical protein
MAVGVRAWIIAALLVGGAIDARAQSFTAAPQVTRWMSHYYENPQPERVEAAVRYLSKSGYLGKRGSAPAVMGFISGVMAANPAEARTLALRLADLPEAQQPVLLIGLWYSGVPDSAAIFRELLPRMPGQKKRISNFIATAAPKITDIPPERGSWVIDMLWGDFIATGSDAPVKRIIDVLAWLHPGGEHSQMAVGASARWSLTGNAIQHERVLQICKAELARRPRDSTAILSQVVREAEAQRSRHAQSPRPGR